MAQLQAAFFNSFKQHIYINTLDVAGSSSGVVPPYLQFALACLAAVTSPPTNVSPYNIASGTSDQDVSCGLFVAGVNLWSVMLEVDNREARLLEAVIAVDTVELYCGRC